MEKYHAKRQKNVEQSHERNQLFRYTSDALDAAKEHQSDRGSQKDAHSQIKGTDSRVRQDAVACEGRPDSRCDGVDLSGISGSEYSKDTENGKKIGEPHPFFPKPIFDIVHGTSGQVAVRISFPEMNRQSNLGKFGAHS